MMTGVILVTHGDAGTAMLEAAQKVVGPLPLVSAVGVPLGEKVSDVQHRIEDAVVHMETQDVLFLVDLGGSTPANLCCKQCGGHGVVVSGLNMAMLLKLATSDRGQGARLLADDLVASAAKAIRVSEGHP